MKKFLIKQITVSFALISLLASSVSAGAAWTQDDFQYASPNLIKNPGFEEGVAGWTMECDAQADARSAYSGRFGLRVTSEKGIATISQGFRFPKSGQYEFSVLLRAEGAEGASCYVRFDSTVNKRVVSQSTSRALHSETWQRVAMTLDVLEENVGVNYEIKFQTLAVKALHMDDVRLVSRDSLPPPIPVAPNSNKVPNPGFEAGLQNWVSFQPGPPYSSSEISTSTKAYTGLRGMKVYSVQSRPVVATKLPGNLPEGEYEISCKLFFDDSTDLATFAMGIHKEPSVMNGLASSTSMVASGGQWRTFSFTTWLSPQDTSYLVLSGMYHDYFIVDDVAVVPTGYDMNRQAQLLKNPGFEEALTNWTAYGANAFTTQDQAMTGSGSAYFGYFESGPMASYLEQGVPAQGAGIYTLSAYFNPEASLSGVGGILSLEARDAGGTVLKSANSSGVSGPAGRWQKARVSLNVPAGAAVLVVKVGGVYCTGGFYVDNANLAKGV